MHPQKLDKLLEVHIIFGWMIIGLKKICENYCKKILFVL